MAEFNPETSKPIDALTPSSPSGEFNPDVSKPAIFYPSAEKTKREIEKGGYKGETDYEKKPFSLGEIAESGGIGAALNVAAPRVARGLGTVMEKMPGPVGRAGKALEITGRVLGNTPAYSRGFAGFGTGAASDVAGQLTEQAIHNKPVRFLVELGVGSIPALNKAVEKFVFSKLARQAGGFDAISALHVASKEIAGLGSSEQKVLDSMAKALGGEKYEQNSMEYIYLLVGREGIKDMAKTQAEVDRILTTAKQEADRVKASNVVQASRILNEANRKAADLMETANNRLKNNVVRRLGVEQAGTEKVAQAKQNLNTMVGEPRTLSTIGNDVRQSVKKSQEGLVETRNVQRDKDIPLRNQEIAQKVNAGDLISQRDDYKNLVFDLQKMLLRNIRSIPREAPVTAKAQVDQLTGLLNSLEGMPLVIGKRQVKIPPDFNAIDQIRRNLGETFKGKPPEGYQAINADFARDMYIKLSKIMGEYSPAHKEFISNYESLARELDIYKSKSAKKSTALDGWIEGNFSTDASQLAPYYFSSGQRVSDLLELTKNPALVEKAAGEYVSNILLNKDSRYVKNWLNDKKNRDWLEVLPNVRQKIETYADQLAKAESYAGRTESIVKKINLGEKQIPATAERAGKLEQDIAKREARRLTQLGEAQGKEIEKLAEQSTGELRDRIKEIESMVDQKKSPVDAFAKYVLVENAPGNIKKVAKYIVDETGNEQFQKAVINTMARIGPNNIPSLYQSRIRYALEGSGLYTPKQLAELDRNVQAAREPNIIERLIKGLIIAPTAAQSASYSRDIFNTFNPYPLP